MALWQFMHPTPPPPGRRFPSLRSRTKYNPIRARTGQVPKPTLVDDGGADTDGRLGRGGRRALEGHGRLAAMGVGIRR